MDPRPPPKLPVALAASLVPYMHTLTDVVTLFSCASPLRDVVAPKMMEVLAAGDSETADTMLSDSSVTHESGNVIVQGSWQQHGNTTSQILQHAIFQGGRSATSCMVMKKVDISARHEDAGNLFLASYVGKADSVAAAARNISNSNNASPNSEAFVQHTQQFLRVSPGRKDTTAAASSPIPVDDDVIIRIAKECVNLEELVADRAVISDNSLTHASVALARNENFTKISLRECSGRLLRDLSGLARVRTLKHVDVSMTAVDFHGVAPLAELPVLETLLLIRCLNLVSVDCLATSPSLQTLNITASPIKNIDALAGLRTLRHIFADGTKIQKLSGLQDSTSLRSISLRNVPCAEDELEALANVATLEKLAIYNANVESVDFLSGFTNISSLDVGQLPLRTADLSRGEAKPCLSRLMMCGCPVVETIVIQKFWKNTLQYLSLQQCVRLGDDGVEGLETLQHLRFLHLGSTAITDKTVSQCISQLSELVELDLSNTHVSSVSPLCPAAGGSGQDNAAAPPSGGTRNLRILKLECCKYLTERGLARIGQLEKLEELDLSCTAVRSLAGVMSEPWPALQRLALRGMLSPPKGLAHFCLARGRTMDVLDLTGVPNRSHSGAAFTDVARMLRRNSYIWVEGFPFEMLTVQKVEEDPCVRAVRGLEEVMQGHAKSSTVRSAN